MKQAALAPGAWGGPIARQRNTLSCAPASLEAKLQIFVMSASEKPAHNSTFFSCHRRAPLLRGT